jgi:hypothetical protein
MRARMKSSLLVCLLALVACVSARAWVDDYKITIASARDIETRRQALIEYIWGKSGFPSAPSDLIDRNIQSPAGVLENLERVEKLRTTMPTKGEPILVSSYHFIPLNKKNRLVVLVQGHGCPGFLGDGRGGDGGMHDAIKALVEHGYGALALFMPRNSDEQCVPNGHPELFSLAPAGMSGMAYFLEPTAKSLNYIIRQYPAYRDISMLGLSGGGWTTTVYAAIDPRIKLSIPISGSIPLYLRKATYSHDEEQFDRSFYDIAGYLDLYVLGSYGKGRKEIQYFIRADSCCFSAQFHDPTLPHVADRPLAERGFEPSIRLYEKRIQSLLSKLGAGSFRIFMDDVTPIHTISLYAIQNVILPVLDSSAQNAATEKSK